jgi:hypothetical protein
MRDVRRGWGAAAVPPRMRAYGRRATAAEGLRRRSAGSGLGRSEVQCRYGCLPTSTRPHTGAVWKNGEGR